MDLLRLTSCRRAWAASCRPRQPCRCAFSTQGLPCAVQAGRRALAGVMAGTSFAQKRYDGLSKVQALACACTGPLHGPL